MLLYVKHGDAFPVPFHLVSVQERVEVDIRELSFFQFLQKEERGVTVRMLLTGELPKGNSVTTLKGAWRSLRECHEIANVLGNYLSDMKNSGVSVEKIAQLGAEFNSRLCRNMRIETVALPMNNGRNRTCSGQGGAKFYKQVIFLLFPGGKEKLSRIVGETKMYGAANALGMALKLPGWLDPRGGDWNWCTDYTGMYRIENEHLLKSFSGVGLEDSVCGVVPES
jgi:hypothetical protein